MADKEKRSMFEFPEALEKQKELVEEFHARRREDRSAAYQWLYDEFIDLWGHHTETHVGEHDRKKGKLEKRKDAAKTKRPTLLDRFRRTSVEHLVGTGNGQVLEIGCNHGLYTILMSYGNEKAVGVDISPKALKMADGHKEQLGVENVEFVHMDGIDMKFPDNTFDWILTKDCLEHIHPDDVRPHLQSCLRVLKPGGRILVITPHRQGYHRHREGHLIYFTYAQLRDELFEAGFAKVKTPFLRTNMPVGLTHKILLERFYYALGMRRGLGGLGVRSVTMIGQKAK